MGTRFVSWIDGVISGSYANPQSFATEEIDEDAPEYVAWIASLVRQPSIPVSLIIARIEVEGMWNTYVDYMFGSTVRRNAFLRGIFLAQSGGIKTNDTAFINSLLSAGLTQGQVDRIMAV